MLARRLVIALLVCVHSGQAGDCVGSACPLPDGQEDDGAALLQRESSEQGRSLLAPRRRGIVSFKMKDQHSGINFDCLRAGAGQAGKHGDQKVLLLHGHFARSDMWTEVMLALQSRGHVAVACDGRGYNSARKHNPDEVEEYSFEHLRSDIYWWAKRLGWEKFHIVGHHIGGILGWFSMQSGPQGSEQEELRHQILSFTSLSQPHNDAMNDVIYHRRNDLQVALLQEWRAAVLPDSAHLHNNYLYEKHNASRRGFSSPEEFQRALWWFNGMIDTGVVATPPLLSVARLQELKAEHAGTHYEGQLDYAIELRQTFGGSADTGAKELRKFDIGTIPIRVALICASHDALSLCTELSQKTMNKLIKAAEYESVYIEVPCDHMMLSDHCSERSKVVEAIVANVENRNHE